MAELFGQNGKKIAEGMFEGTSPSPTLRHAAAMALTEAGISAEVAPGQWYSTYAEPAGVAGIIVPWNSPVALLVRSLAPALSAGNTVAVKMPGQTALVANLVSRIIAEVTSLPRGVVNIFTESGSTGAVRMSVEPGPRRDRVMVADDEHAMVRVGAQRVDSRVEGMTSVQPPDQSIVT